MNRKDKFDLVYFCACGVIITVGLVLLVSGCASAPVYKWPIYKCTYPADHYENDPCVATTSDWRLCFKLCSKTNEACSCKIMFEKCAPDYETCTPQKDRKNKSPLKTSGKASDDFWKTDDVEIKTITTDEVL